MGTIDSIAALLLDDLPTFFSPKYDIPLRIVGISMRATATIINYVG
jgi:hypothetical protein